MLQTKLVTWKLWIIIMKCVTWLLYHFPDYYNKQFQFEHDFLKIFSNLFPEK